MADFNFHCEMVPFTEDGFFWITFTGDISLGRLGKAHEEFTSHPDYVDGIDELLDFSQTSIKNLKKPEIDMIKQYVMARPDRHNNKSVMVVSSEVEYGLGRMLGSLLDDAAPVDRRVCYALHDALEWLRPGRADELLAAYPSRQASVGSTTGPRR